MKTLLNKFNKIGIFAVLFAALVVTTQSAFTDSNRRATTLYGKDATLPLGWRNLSAISEDPSDPYNDNSYRCEVNVNSICTGQFDNTAPPTSPSSVPLSGTTRTGDFIYTAP